MLSRSPRREIETDLDDELVVGEVGPAEPQAEIAATATRRERRVRRLVVEVEDVDVDERRRHVGAVAAGVHPHRAADRSRNADRPLEPGDRRRRRPPGEHRQARRRRRR